VEPHGGGLKVLYLPRAEAAARRREAAGLPALDLTQRQLCDLKLLLNGGFSPLGGFMGRRDHAAVCADMRLADGTLWPIPITLDVSRQFAEGVATGDLIGLRDPEGFLIALLTVEDVFEPDREQEAALVFGTTDDAIRASTICSTARSRSASAAGSRGWQGRPSTISASCATSPPTCAASSSSGAGRAWSRSRHATRCTGRIRS
jgi:ATP sulfurylase